MPVSAKRTKTAEFHEATRGARRVMLLDLGFLGDSIHLLPALWILRQAYPDAELHVMVSEHVTKIMEVAPWIDKIWGYPRFPRGPKWYQDFSRVQRLRAAKFDVVVNLNGSDRSSILTRLSGARWRLGRRPGDGGPALWGAMFTHIVEYPYKTELISTQRWHALKKAGFPGEKPEVHIEIPEEVRRRALEKAGGGRGWIHVSPFTTVNYRELSFDQMAEVLNELNKCGQSRKVILTCAGNERERGRMDQLLPRLDFTPWRVFRGDLDLLELSAIIAASDLHLGGDSGGNHVAWMVGTPSVTWYREFEGLPEWILRGEKCLAFVGQQDDSGIRGIQSEGLVKAARAQLA
jgi:ADP-heptose:LPS heptosyltransferase